VYAGTRDTLYSGTLSTRPTLLTVETRDINDRSPDNASTGSWRLDDEHAVTYHVHLLYIDPCGITPPHKYVDTTI